MALASISKTTRLAGSAESTSPPTFAQALQAALSAGTSKASVTAPVIAPPLNGSQGPLGFQSIMNPMNAVNTYGQQTQCYHCTVAALLGMTTDQLVNHTGNMQEDTGTVQTALRTFYDAGVRTLPCDGRRPCDAVLQCRCLLPGSITSQPAGAIKQARGNVRSQHRK